MKLVNGAKRAAFFMCLALLGRQGMAQCQLGRHIESFLAEARANARLHNVAESSVQLMPPRRVPRLGTTLYSIRENIGGFGAWYRLAIVGDSVLRLSGWPCDNIAQWVGALRPLEVADRPHVWQLIFALAAALNPVGDSTRVYAPEPIQGLAPGELVRSEIAGVVAPELREDAVGGWRGTVSVLWYRGGYHRMAAATMTFGLDREGRIVLLQVSPIVGLKDEAKRTILPADGPRE